MKNYLIYPFKTMNITQSPYVGNHLPHNTGTPKDYPLDEACADTGRDYMYCPCDSMTIKKLYGDPDVGHHVWLESTTKVEFANGTSDYVTIFAVHLNKDDYSKLKVGQTFKRGEAMFREGTSGVATGNHIHFSTGKGKASTAGYWQKNSKIAWVLLTSNGPIKPENAYYIDTNFTKVKNNAKLAFKNLPQEDDDMSRGYFMKGDANEGVLAIKMMLIQLRDAGVISQKVSTSNKYDSAVERAIKEVQEKSNLATDGKCGPLTTKACGELIAKAIKKRETERDSAIGECTKLSTKLDKIKKIVE